MTIGDVVLPNGFWNITTQTASALPVRTAYNGSVALFKVAEAERPDKSSPTGKSIKPIIIPNKTSTLTQYILQPCTEITISDSEHFLDLVRRRLIVGITLDKSKLQRFKDLQGAGTPGQLMLVTGQNKYISLGQDKSVALNITACEKSIEPTAEALKKFNDFAVLFGKPASSETERKIAAEKAEQKVGKENVSTAA
ncbi:MAG: hypothetical protein H0X51_05275 [Parachlamydiaceae bacterium]|nr:hypothetical protein [Parachlamydiaceae bacterium]